MNQNQSDHRWNSHGVVRKGQPLSPSETLVYNLIVHEALNSKQIAEKINRTVRTVKYHVSNILFKKDAANVLELAVMHYQNKALKAA